MSDEHYLSKIQRNQNVIDKAPENVKMDCLNNLRWAIEISKRLDQLDYDVRENTIDKIHRLMDEDYVKMGFELEKKSGFKL